MKFRFLLLFILFPLISIGQTTIEQVGLDIDGEATGDTSATSISYDDSGTVVAVGAPNNQGNGFKSGHVRVFENTTGSWVQVGSNINGETTFDYLGFAVSLSADATTLAAGAPFKQIDDVQTGQVSIYRNIDDTWTLFGAPLTGEGPGDQYGSSVAISDDGTIVAIGANLNDGNGVDAGHVRVFKNSDDSWVQIGADIDGQAAGDNAGWSVSLNGNGTVLAIGSIANDAGSLDAGQVRVFENTEGTWLQLGGDINGEAPSDSSGWSVSLNDDGNILAVGAPFNNGNGTGSGEVRVYQNSGGSWVQLGEDINGLAPGDGAGWSVSLNEAGDILAIGARGGDGNGINSGQVVIYKFTGGSWVQVGEAIDGEEVNDFSGTAVGLNATGTLVAIGAPLNDGNGLQAGHVRVFDITNLLGTNQQTGFDFAVFPSPTNGILTVQTAANDYKVTVFNQLGQQLFSAQNMQQIDITDKPTGLYIVQIITKNGRQSRVKVVKR